VRPHGVANLAWIGALRLLDSFDDDVRRRQSAGLLSQRAAEDFHARIVHLLAGILGQQAAHLGDVFLVFAALVRALLEHRRATGRRAHTRARPTHAWPWRTHPWSEWRPRPTHRRAQWARTWAWRGSGQACCTWQQLRLELARAASAARPASGIRPAWTPPTVSTGFAFGAAMFAAGRAAPSIAVELAIRIVVRVEIALD
jgi:hypothetical protein